jgi:hypothetical protein
VGALISHSSIAARDALEQETDEIPARPSIMFNRWQEEWSVLADPRVPKEALDSLKYIPLSADDPEAYLSFGANLRERFEANTAASFGYGHKPQCRLRYQPVNVFATADAGSRAACCMYGRSHDDYWESRSARVSLAYRWLPLSYVDDAQQH